jgi:endo-1,4-beta-D-glucanase Y
MLTCGNQCIDPQTNQQNCGSCGHVCSGNLPACVAGQCGCPVGQSLCATTNTCTVPSACPTGGGVGGMNGGTGGTNGTAGTTGGVGGTTGGVGGGSGPARACPATTTAPTGLASIDVISDFEEGTPPGAVMVAQGTPKRTGWWYDYGDSTTGLTPPPSGGAVASEAIAGSTDMCNKWDFHATATGHPMFAGFGATFSPAAPPSTSKTAYPLTGWDGITFKMKSGGGTNPALFFQVLTKENQPIASGGNIAPTTTGGTTYSPAHVGTDLYNGRGVLLNSPTSSWQSAIGTNYATYYIPFGMMVPQWVPGPGGAKGGCSVTAAAGDPKCQSPAFVPASALSFQLSVLSDFAGTAGNYNVIVDDVMLYKRATTGNAVDLPAPPTTATTAAHPFPQNATLNARCTKPTGPSVDGRFLVSAYNQWRTQFTRAEGGGIRVVRPAAETMTGEDSVSEGIAYGMLIGVYMNDKALFDGLWAYWRQHCDGNTKGGGCLMTWRVGGAGGTGTATDADEDAAFAMLMASRQWGAATLPAGDTVAYGANATTLMHAVLATDMSTANPVIKGGSNYADGANTNASYFAPAWYRAFAAADPTNATAWTNLANGAYTLLGSANAISSQGLISAWCNSSCTMATMNGGSANSATDVIYQYDSHRIPFRIGIDYCWNGTAAASTYLTKINTFFTGKAANGVGRVLDQYTPGGGDVTGSAPNSASILGTSAVGAMSSAANATYINDAYQTVFDMSTRGTLATTAGSTTPTPYSYFNSTVGLLTMLFLTGNFTLF